MGPTTVAWLSLEEICNTVSFYNKHATTVLTYWPKERKKSMYRWEHLAIFQVPENQLH